MLVKPRYFEYGNQPLLFGSRDLVPVMPRLGVWHPSAKNRGFGTPGSVQAPNYGESRGLVPRFLPTSAIWFLASGEMPGRDLPERLLRVPNLKIRPTVGIKLEISPRKGTKPRDPAEKTALRDTKPPKLAEARQPAWQKARAKPLILQKLNISYLSILQKRNLLSYTALQKPHYCR